MKIYKRYAVEASNEIIEFLRQHNIKYRKIYQNHLDNHIVFDTDISDNTFPSARYSCLFEYGVYSKEEYDNAEWLAFRGYDKLSICQNRRTKAYSEHRYTQVGDYIFSRQPRWTSKYQILAEEGTPSVMFCSTTVKALLETQTSDIYFRCVCDKSGKVYDNFYQIQFKTVLPTEAFVFKGPEFGEEREATVCEYDDGIIISVRNPTLFVPKIKRSFLDGKDAVVSESIWGPGIGHPMCFCNQRIYQIMINNGLDKCLNFTPIELLL